ncbi:MAG TPA: hypothetical protein VG734_18085 [Lacunisphaera sp.]|nr:hypothetical protein [Lacunisphaera sp.]
MTTQLAEPQGHDLAPERDRADRSILIGIACTLLFHVALLLLSPRFSFNEFSGVHTGITVQRANTGKTFDFELAPMTAPEKERLPSQFVDTNPEAPANEPDKTDNFSNRNQQSAQMEKPKELDPEHRPSITNAQDQIKNDASIVSGDLADPQLGQAALPEPKTTAETEQTEQKLRMEQATLSGFDKSEGKSEDGVASNVSQSKAPSTGADQNVEGSRDATDPNGGLVQVNPTQKVQPKARPRLTAPRTTILTNRAAGVSNVGIIGRDARWSEYGEYLAELEEIVQVQWYHILAESRVMPPRGSHVIITFKINSKGETDIVKVEDSDAGKQGVFSCQNAIQARQPYRKWTEQMIAVLGEEQTLVFAFYYQ